MKRYKIILTALAVALPAVSCNKISCDEMEISSTDGICPEVITASIANEVCDATKVTFNRSTRKLSWDEGDRIVVGGATYVKDSSTMNFKYYSGGVTSDATSDVIAFYPCNMYSGSTEDESESYSLPEIYTICTATDAIDYLPMAGALSGKHITFYNLCSLFEVTVNNLSGSDIYFKGVCLSADVPLSGAIDVKFKDDVPDIQFPEDRTTYQTVEVKTDSLVRLAHGESYKVYIPVPPASISYFNVKVTAYTASTADPSSIVFFNSTQAFDQPVTTERSSYYPLKVNASSFKTGIVGNGTMSQPFEISALESLEYIYQMINSADEDTRDYFCSACYALTSDITLQSTWTQTMAGSSVSDEEQAFSGVFDGQGHTICASAGVNTQPMFWDTKNAVIKNVVLKGDFKHIKNVNHKTKTFSPFFYAATTTDMISVVFEGDISTDPDAGYGENTLSVFGAMCDDSYIVGCYAKGDIDSAYYYSRDYYQLYSAVSIDHYGDAYPTPYGIVAESTSTSTLYSDESGSIDVSNMEQEAIMNYLNGKLDAWNASLQNKLSAGTITIDEYNRHYADYTYSTSSEGITLRKTSN